MVIAGTPAITTSNPADAVEVGASTGERGLAETSQVPRDWCARA